jgi:transposase
MKMPISRCKFSRKVQIELLKYFIAEVTARRAADLIGINRNSCNLYYRKIREAIRENLEEDARESFSGEIELDESYFGGVRKGKRGRGAAGKVVVFGILKRGGKVFTKVIDDTKTATLMPIIRQKVMPDSIVYTDTYRSYNALDVSEFVHHRINHSTHFATDAKHHINGIENFWNQAKRVLRKYNGIPKESFNLFLKECEFRFNYGTAKEQLKILKKWCLDS